VPADQKPEAAAPSVLLSYVRRMGYVLLAELLPLGVVCKDVLLHSGMNGPAP
jgi:hypothetical protein